jgi:serine/threonine protein kinase
MASTSEPDARIGTTLCGKWTIERELGAGGMASVYVARHKIGRRDAVKILRGDLARDPIARERFEREARAANRFHHPGAVEIRDIDVCDTGEPFLVMELLEGESLSARARRLGGIPVDELLRHTDELLDVLAAAHEHGIIHRDIKPPNLFVTSDGRLKVLDFGIARIHKDGSPLTRAGDAVGTAAYMAPEQVLGRDIDARVDLFAVGATMFLFLAERRVHETDSEAAMLTKMATLPAPKLATVARGVSADVCAIVDRALTFDRERRYPDAATMQTDVRAVRRGTAPPYAAALRSDEGHVDQAATVSERRHTDGKPTRPGSAIDAPEPDRAAELIGARLGDRYRLGALLGQGGMGAVFEARDDDGRACAVKVILNQQAEVRKRFAREARAIAAIDSPHVVTVLDAGSDEATGLPFLAMEKLDGVDLSRMIAAHGALDPEAVARIFLQACRGLSAAHTQGIVHRDIKPANLFLAESSDGVTVKILDFGIAKGGRELGEGATALTRAGGMLGTAIYMSPEQAMNAKLVDARTDLWSLGMSMFESLTGLRPWSECSTEGELIVALCTKDPPSIVAAAPWLDRAVVDVIERCLARDRAQRWGSADELAAALGELIGERERIERADLVPIRASLRTPALAAYTRAPRTLKTNDVTSRPAQTRRAWLALSAVATVLAGGYALRASRQAPRDVAASPAPLASQAATAAPNASPNHTSAAPADARSASTTARSIVAAAPKQPTTKPLTSAEAIASTTPPPPPSSDRKPPPVNKGPEFDEKDFGP